MKKLINLISEEVTKAFVSAGYDEKYGKVTHFQTDRTFVSSSVTEQWQRQKSISVRHL